MPAGHRPHPAADRRGARAADHAVRHLYAVVEGLRWPTLIGAYTPDQALAVLDDHRSTLFG